MKTFRVFLHVNGRTIPMVNEVTARNEDEALSFLGRRDERAGRPRRSYRVAEIEPPRDADLPPRKSLEELAAITGRAIRARREAGLS